MIGLSTMNTIRVRDLLERMLWTAVSAAGGALVGAAIFDFNAWEAAVTAAFTSVINLLTIIARWRLSALPNPGEGLPGLPTEEAHEARA